jgi:hypothetical protein
MHPGSIPVSTGGETARLVGKYGFIVSRHGLGAKFGHRHFWLCLPLLAGTLSHLPTSLRRGDVRCGRQLRLPFAIAILPYAVQTFLRFERYLPSFTLHLADLSLILLTLSILRVRILRQRRADPDLVSRNGVVASYNLPVPSGWVSRSSPCNAVAAVLSRACAISDSMSSVFS